MTILTDRRTFVVTGLAVSTSLLPGGVWAQAVQTPAQIVSAIYTFSAGKNGKYEGKSALNDRAARRRYFSAGLVALVERAQALERQINEPIIGFDPISNSQDPSVNKLSVASEKEDDARAIVAARFFYSLDDKEPNIVRYHLIREKDAWRVDDISGSVEKDPWELRKVLTGGIADAQKQQRKGRR